MVWEAHVDTKVSIYETVIKQFITATKNKDYLSMDILCQKFSDYDMYRSSMCTLENEERNKGKREAFYNLWIKYPTDYKRPGNEDNSP